MRKGSVFAIAALVVASCSARQVWAHDADGKNDGLFSQAEGHVSFLTDAADRSTLNDTYGWAGKLGYRDGGWGAFVQFEQNLWGTQEFERTIVSGAFNVGVGGELLYFQERARTSIALGPSVLLFDTPIDNRGTTGMFLDVRAVGLRWRVHDRVLLQFDPLTFTLVGPVLGSIPLVQIEYRQVLTLEFALWRDAEGT